MEGIKYPWGTQWGFLWLKTLPCIKYPLAVIKKAASTIFDTKNVISQLKITPNTHQKICQMPKVWKKQQNDPNLHIVHTLRITSKNVKRSRIR